MMTGEPRTLKPGMRQGAHGLARLNRRIADVRQCIEDVQRDDSEFCAESERLKMLALLNSTLKDLEAHKAALERADR
jgi:hypothetical protein